jgi:hypothetical protein
MNTNPKGVPMRRTPTLPLAALLAALALPAAALSGGSW